MVARGESIVFRERILTALHCGFRIRSVCGLLTQDFTHELGELEQPHSRLLFSAIRVFQLIRSAVDDVVRVPLNDLGQRDTPGRFVRKPLECFEPLDIFANLVWRECNAFLPDFLQTLCIWVSREMVRLVSTLENHRTRLVKVASCSWWLVRGTIPRSTDENDRLGTCRLTLEHHGLSSYTMFSCIWQSRPVTPFDRGFAPGYCQNYGQF
jgi:hypothetical protein